jgi:alpha/beta superfamily hydrolase
MALLEESTKKVVLIGHSQGGLIVTLVVDRLLSEMLQDVLAKLEVYTFASFANHFSDPLESRATRDEEKGTAQEKTDRAQNVMLFTMSSTLPTKGILYHRLVFCTSLLE